MPGNEDPFRYNLRAQRADRGGADYVIFIHLNSGSPTARGRETYYYEGQSASYQFAQAVDARLREITALVGRGIFAHNSGRSKGAKNILPAYYTNGGTLPTGKKGKRMIPILTECVVDGTGQRQLTSLYLAKADKADKGFLVQNKGKTVEPAKPSPRAELVTAAACRFSRRMRSQ